MKFPATRDLCLVGLGASLAFLIEDVGNGKTGSAVLMAVAAVLLAWEVWRSAARATAGHRPKT